METIRCGAARCQAKGRCIGQAIRCGATRCRPCEAERCQANGRSIGQRGAVHGAPHRDIVVEGSTVWGDVNTSANHTVWSNTMPTAQRGAARCQAKGRCIGPRDAGRDSTGLCIGHAV